MTPDGCEIRAADAEETDALLHVLCAAFGLPFDIARPLFYGDPFFDLSHKRLLRTAQEGIVSCLTVIPTRLQIGAAWVLMGGIAGVATLPACRGRGYAGRLLSATVSALAEELHYPLAGLFAYSEAYYRRFGWETVSQSRRRSGTLLTLPDRLEAASVRALDPARTDDMKHVHRLHAALTGHRTGACARDARRWRILQAAPERAWVLYQNPFEPPAGYAVYEWEDGMGSPILHLLEMHGATPEARRGLVGYLARQGTDSVQWNWPASPESVQAFGSLLPGVNGPSEPGLMLRLIDTAAALNAVHAVNLAPVLARTGQALTLRVTDAQRPENARPVRLTVAGVVPGGESDPDWIAADIRTVAQCYFGYRTPSEAQTQGTLQASSPAALALADALFPARAPFVAPLDQF